MDTQADDAYSYPKELKNTVNRLNKRGGIFKLWACSTTRNTIGCSLAMRLNTLFDDSGIRLRGRPWHHRCCVRRACLLPSTLTLGYL
jgi:hypothetical protein